MSNWSPSWEFAEKSVRGFIELMTDLDILDGASLFVYPDVAKEQKQLFREMSDAGIETALHLNGMRYSRLGDDKANWLGAMTYDQQKEAISMAKKDLEDVTGKKCTGYRACYGSANDDIFVILEELGFTWASDASGRYRFETSANWWGSWPYAHFASAKSKLILGDLNLFQVPITRGMETFLEDDRNRPFDLRVESPVELIGRDRKLLRKIVEENLVYMQRMNVPVRGIIGASHNTSDYGDFENYRSQNLRGLVRHTKEFAKEYEMDFAPASFEELLTEAKRVNSY